MRPKMQMRPGISRAKRIAAAAIIALGVASALAGARPALGAVAAGETAFKNGDFMIAVREFRGPAYRGDAMAQYYLGVIYADGLGAVQSYEVGLAWLICAQTGGLPPVLGQDAGRRRSRISSRISSYGLEYAEKEAKALCGKAVANKKKTFSEDKDPLEKIRPVRGFWAMLFFFPGDTMMSGAVVTFHELGLYFVRNILVGMVKLFGDLLFGLLALIGWIIIGRFLRFFLEPVWQRILTPGASAHNATKGGSGQSQAQESESDKSADITLNANAS